MLYRQTSWPWANQGPVINFGINQNRMNYYQSGVINFGAVNINTGTYNNCLNYGQYVQTKPNSIMNFNNTSIKNPYAQIQNLRTSEKPRTADIKENPRTTQKTNLPDQNTPSQTPTKRAVVQTDSNKEFNELLIDNAAKYIGLNEKDNSFKIFSESTEWCADFVTYVVKETYEQKGLKVPANFGHHRCEILRQWAVENNCMIDVAHSQDKVQTIVQNVKPGDILILREGDPKFVSHTGIVTKVNSDGTFETIEGNIPIDGGTDGVGTAKYKPDNKFITGFIRLPH